MTIGEAIEAIKKVKRVTNGKACGILERKDDNLYFDIENGGYVPIKARFLENLRLA